MKASTQTSAIVRGILVMSCAGALALAIDRFGAQLHPAGSDYLALRFFPGISLTAIWLWGWPAALGSFAGSVLFVAGTAGLPLHMNAAVSAVAALASWVAVLAIRRRCGGLPPARARDSLYAFAVLALAALPGPVLGGLAWQVSERVSWREAALLAPAWWLSAYVSTLLITPMLLVTLLYRRGARLAEPVIWPLASLFVGLALLAAATVWRVERRNLMRNVENRAREVYLVVSAEFDAGVNALYAIRSFVIASGHVTREEFAIFTAPFLARDPSLQGLCLLQRVPHQEREAFEQAVRAEGFRDFRIIERDAQLRAVPAAERDEYNVFTYMQPVDSLREHLFGYDATSTLEGYETHLLAMNSGRPVAAIPVQSLLLPAAMQHMRVILSCAKPHLSRKAATDNRFDSFDMVSGSFRVNDMLQRALRNMDTGDMEFLLYDVTPAHAARLLVHYPPPAGWTGIANRSIRDMRADCRGLCATQSFKLYERDLLLIARHRSGTMPRTAIWKPALTLAVGLTVAGLLLFFLHVRQQGERRLWVLEDSNRKLMDDALEGTIEGWSKALDLRDCDTEGHTLRVTEMVLRLAQAFGLRGDALQQIRRGSLLHDIGKMGVPDSVLLKTGALTEEECAIMRRHPQYARELLAPIRYLEPAMDIPCCHHERWDGTGYPRGLRGTAIPLAARIFAVVDVWDALRSSRPYRAAWPEARVREHLRQRAGSHFDPTVVAVFLKLLEQLDPPAPSATG